MYFGSKAPNQFKQLDLELDQLQIAGKALQIPIFRLQVSGHVGLSERNHDSGVSLCRRFKVLLL